MARYFKRTLGIDLGTVNTVIYDCDKGLILGEPSVVAVNVRTGDAVAAGAEAFELIKRNPGEIVARHPMKEGAVADYDLTEYLLRTFLKKTAHPSPLKTLKVVVCVPCNISEAEKKAAIDATVAAGARDVYLLEEPIATAIGTGVRADCVYGCMVVDIGGGTTDISIISLGGIVTQRTIYAAGNAMDDEITKSVAKEYGVDITDATAEAVKKELGSVTPRGEIMRIVGRSTETLMPCKITIDDHRVCPCIVRVLDKIVTGIGELLMETPPEFSADIVKNGIVLTGGVSLINGCAEYISECIGVKVSAGDPLALSARGASRVLVNR